MLRNQEITPDRGSTLCKALEMLDWAAVHGGYIMIKRFGFPLLICAAFLASSSLNSAHAAPKGSRNVSLTCVAQGGGLGKDYNTHKLFCDTGSVCTQNFGYYICSGADGAYSCCRSRFESCDPGGVFLWPHGFCRPWAGR
jgi:hypothetical protein